MDDIRSGKVKAALFLFFIVILVVGGYIGMVVLTKDTKSVENKDKEVAKTSEKEDIRIDKNKDYIYFDNEVIKNETRELYIKM